MNTLPTTRSKSTLPAGADVISPRTEGYAVGMSQSDAFELVHNIFDDLVKSENFTRATIARRINRDPAQVTRWLSSPSNWTIETFTLLLLAMGKKPIYDAEDTGYERIKQYVVHIGYGHLMNAPKSMSKSTQPMSLPQSDNKPQLIMLKFPPIKDSAHHD